MTEKENQEGIQQINYLASLIEQTSDAIFSIDTDFVIRSWNNSAEKIYGFVREEAIGQKTATLIKSHLTDEERTKAIADLKRLGFYQNEFGVTHKNGTIITVMAQVSALRNEDGEITGYVVVHRDISEQKKAEVALSKLNEELEQRVNERTEELNKSEKRFHALVENNEGIISLIDEKSNVIFRSSSAVRISGWTNEEFEKTNGIEYVHPEDVATVKAIMARAIENPGETIPILVREKHKNGHYIWLEGMVKNMIHDPAIGGIITNLLDVTERKKAEQVIKESEIKYRSVVENIHESLVIEDIDGRLLYANDEFSRIFGFSPDEFIKLSIKDYTSPASYAEVIERHNNRMKGIPVPEEFVYKGMRKDGTEIWIETRVSTLIENGKIVGTQSLERDVTDRQKAEQQIIKEKNLSDSIINSMPGVFYLFDTTPKFLRWNKFFETVSGYSEDELRTMVPMSLFEGDDKLIMKQRIEKTFKEGHAYAETSLVTKKGDKIPFFFTGVSVNYEGKPCILGTGLDISDRKKAEDEMLQINRRLRELSEHLQNIREEERLQMSREIHDELGQQLTVMKMDISWLHKKMETADEPVKQKMDGLKSMLDQTVKTVRRIASELRPSLLDDMGLGAAIEWQLSEFEKRSGVKTEFSEVKRELPLPDAVKTGLFRIVQESLTNVGRYAKAKKVTVSLQQQSEQLVLTIKDDGAGFDKEKIAAKKTLGILGMKERTAMMGGIYEINSTPEKGTTVVVSVPCSIQSSN